MILKTVNAGLGILSSEELKQAQGEKVLSCCNFEYKKMNEDSSNSFDLVRLMIKQNYLLQIDEENGSIISGFFFEYCKNFKILTNHSLGWGNPSQPHSIIFLLSGSKNSDIEFFITKNSVSEVEKFILVLQQRFIVQVGFHEKFKAQKILGTGANAKVYQAIRLADSKIVAVKSFQRSAYFGRQNGKESFLKEFKIMVSLKHPNLIHLYGVYESENSTYLVMEMLALSLFDWIKKYGFPSIDESKNILIQLLKAVQYLHSNGIMHRDIKPGNIMIRKNTKDNIEIVLVDMGLAQYYSHSKYMFSKCGTPGYVAPEIFNFSKNGGQKYGASVDIFSLGVVLHFLLFKSNVFMGNTVQQVLKQNYKHQMSLKEEQLNNFDEEGKDLLFKMLEKDPLKRITAQDALNHKYLKTFFNPYHETQAPMIEDQPYNINEMII